MRLGLGFGCCSAVAVSFLPEGKTPFLPVGKIGYGSCEVSCLLGSASVAVAPNL